MWDRPLDHAARLACSLQLPCRMQTVWLRVLTLEVLGDGGYAGISGIKFV